MFFSQFHAFSLWRLQDKISAIRHQILQTWKQISCLSPLCSLLSGPVQQLGVQINGCDMRNTLGQSSIMRSGKFSFLSSKNRATCFQILRLPASPGVYFWSVEPFSLTLSCWCDSRSPAQQHKEQRKKRLRSCFPYVEEIYMISQ